MSAASAGWRVALRLARREAWRRKGQSLLMLLLICLPVAAVTAAAVVWRTSDVSAAESVERRMGAADALVEVTDSERVVQAFDPRDVASWVGEERRRPFTLARLRATLGEDRPVTPIAREWLYVETDRGAADAEVVVADLADPLTDGLFRRVEGKYPPGPGEVVVNRALAERGPGLGDTLTAVREDGDGEHRFELEVVGIAESAAAHGYPAAGLSPDPDGSDIGVGPGDPGPGSTRSWLVGGGPVTWDDVRALNALGALVTSRAVLTDPPPESALPAEVRELRQPVDDATLTVLALIGTMVLLEVVLLAGPAFAVRAKAQAHALALVAAAGGTPRQARRTVLASGVVVGVLGGVVGVAGGVLVGALASPLAQRLDDTAFGPFEVPWALLAVVAGFGLVSAVLAAVVPAYSASRQDVVAVLGGRRGEGRPSHRSPVLGVVLLATGAAAATAGAVQRGPGAPLIAGAAVVSVVGMILLVPVTVTAVGRLAARLPLPLRFAARDAARHRTRTVPAVAAVGATVAGVVALGIAVSSQDAGEERRYEAQLPHGWASVAVTGAEDAEDDVAQVLADRLPGAEQIPVTGPASAGDTWTDLLFRADGEQLAFAYWGSVGTAHVVGTEVPPYVALSSGERSRAEEVLAAGGVVLLRGADDPPPAAPVDEVTVLAERYDGAGQVESRARVDRPAVVAVVDEPMPAVASLVAPEVVERLRVPTATTALVTPGPVSGDADADLTESLAALPAAGYFYVERGYVPDPAVRIAQWVLAALGAVLMLGGTLTATFLALSDARPDLATMSAVGAPPRTRRAVAAAYALVVGLVGAVLGAPVGFIPGLAVSRPLTREVETGLTTVDVPWLLVGAVVVGLPLLTAAAVGACARGRLPLAARVE